MTVRSVQLRAGTLVLNPIQIFGSVVMWVNAGIQASATQVIDQARGVVYSGAGGIAYTTTGPNGLPIWTGNGVDGIFTGSCDIAPPATVPTFIISVWRQESWTSGDSLYGTGSSTLVLSQNSSSPGLAMRNISIANLNNGGTLGTWFLSYQLFTGTTNDINLCGNTMLTGESAGNTDPGGTFAFLARAAASNFSNVSLYEMTMLDFMPNSEQLRLYRQRIRVQSGGQVVGVAA